MLDASEAPIWMIGPSRPTEAPLPMDRAEASDFGARHYGPDQAFAEIDRIDDLGNAAAARLGREGAGQGHDAEAADDRHQHHEGPHMLGSSRLSLPETHGQASVEKTL